MNVLFCAIPGYGHVLPLVPLAQACKGQGYTTTFATGQSMVGRLPVNTVNGFPDWSLSEAEAETKRRHPELAELSPQERYRFAVELFAGVTAECFVNGLDGVLDMVAPDLVVYDVLAVGAVLAALSRDIPSICLGVIGWSFFTELLHRTVAERQELATSSGPLGHAYLDQFPPSMWPPDVVSPPNTHSLRPVPARTTDAVLPSWLREPQQRTRVYLTLGTVAFGATEALEAALDVLDDGDVEVLVAVGPEGDPSRLRKRSERVHFETFVDQASVLPLVDAVVHHGGTGTMLSAMAAGLPQVVMPQGADQFQNASSLTATGAGRPVLPQSPEGALADAIHAALTDPTMKESAERMSVEIGAMPPPATVAADLPRLIEAVP